MADKGKKSKWKLIAWLISIAQFLLGAFAVGVLLWLNMLPVLYIVLTIAGLVLLLAIVVFFLFTGVRRKNADKLSKESKRNRIYAKRSAGVILSILVMLSSAVVSAMILKAGSTLKQIAGQDVITETVSAYVLKDDAAETVADAKNYTFAITEKYDVEHTQSMIKKIEEQTGQTIETHVYEDVFAMVDALYSGDVQAMILNEGYVDIIESEKNYEDFSEKTKILYDHEIQTEVPQDTQESDEDITSRPFVIYVSGSDTRNMKLTTSRSDVNILVVVNPKSKQVLMINTPRDYYVPTTASATGECDKLTHCGIYGIDCSMNTLGQLYDEPVDYYAQINFNGFETLVDAIGGITIDSERSFRTSEGGFYISEGKNELSGKVALSYVRERKSFADGDNSRGRHQMMAIEAIIAKVSCKTTVLTNYSQIMDSMTGLFNTNMSASDIESLVKMQLSDNAFWNVKSYAVTGKGGKSTTYSAPTKRSYVMYPDEKQIEFARTLVNKVVDGKTLADSDLVMPENTEQGGTE